MIFLSAFLPEGEIEIKAFGLAAATEEDDGYTSNGKDSDPDAAVGNIVHEEVVTPLPQSNEIGNVPITEKSLKIQAVTPKVNIQAPANFKIIVSTNLANINKAIKT